MKNNYDVIAIGDTVVDAFIKLSEAHIEDSDLINHGEMQLCMPFASKVPYESVTVIPAVGNSANAAVSASRLGLRCALVSFVGNDVNGRECKFSLDGENVSTEHLIMENGKTTNYHYVLWYKDERTILIKHENFKSYLPDIGTPKWIYLSSLGEHAKELHNDIVRYLVNNPDVKLAFQPGTFQIKMGVDTLRELYLRCHFYCVNVEEAKKILSADNDDIPSLLNKLQQLGPKIVCITDGKNGSYLRLEGENFFMPVYPDSKPAYERTGAGDAFASTLVSMMALNYNPLDAIKYACINSMNVVQHVGAQKGLLTKSQLDKFLQLAPPNYFPIKI
jgi:sugar/nucleoside kinase (ribokinase family)